MWQEMWQELQNTDMDDIQVTNDTLVSRHRDYRAGLPGYIQQLKPKEMKNKKGDSAARASPRNVNSMSTVTHGVSALPSGKRPSLDNARYPQPGEERVKQTQ